MGQSNRTFRKTTDCLLLVLALELSRPHRGCWGRCNREPFGQSAADNAKPDILLVEDELHSVYASGR